MKAKLYFNKSDKRYLNKDISQIGSELTIELIEPSSIIRPSFILSSESRVQEANYIYVTELGRYYYINDYIFEYERIIINCKCDVLMSFAPEIIELPLIMERASTKGKQNFYINDPEINTLAYNFNETHKLKCTTGNGFKKENDYYILAVAGAVTGQSDI